MVLDMSSAFVVYVCPNLSKKKKEAKHERARMTRWGKRNEQLVCHSLTRIVRVFPPRGTSWVKTFVYVFEPRAPLYKHDSHRVCNNSVGLGEMLQQKQNEKRKNEEKHGEKKRKMATYVHTHFDDKNRMHAAGGNPCLFPAAAA